MRRLVWFGMGAITGGWLVLRGREKARQIAEHATPAGIGRAVGRNLGERKVEMSEFLASVADSARQREDELRTKLLMPADHPSTRP